MKKPNKCAHVCISCMFRYRNNKSIVHKINLRGIIAGPLLIFHCYSSETSKKVSADQIFACHLIFSLDIFGWLDWSLMKLVKSLTHLSPMFLFFNSKTCHFLAVLKWNIGLKWFNTVSNLCVMELTAKAIDINHFFWNRPGQNLWDAPDISSAQN